MKKALSIVSLALVCVFAFTSCEKEKTMEEMLTIEKGWKMSAATTTPYWTLGDNTQITDLLNGGYFFDCEKDDVIKFKADGYEYLNQGKDVCEGEPADETSLGKWALNEEAKTLEMQLPFFYDDAVEHVKIAELTEDVLKINYTYVLGGDPVKGVPGTYTFTITYVPAK